MPNTGALACCLNSSSVARDVVVVNATLIASGECVFGVGAFVYFANFNNGKKSIIAAALTLAVMTLPVIIASTKEALSAVPRSFREACWNVGATRWQTIRRIVLPNSISGILTGVILQVSRTAGETAPVSESFPHGRDRP